jgi:hypothetical protein
MLLFIPSHVCTCTFALYLNDFGRIGPETGLAYVSIPSCPGYLAGRLLPSTEGEKQELRHDKSPPAPPRSRTRSPIPSRPMLRPDLALRVTAAELSTRLGVSTWDAKVKKRGACADQIGKHMTYRERHLCDILKAFRRRRALVSRRETSKG